MSNPVTTELLQRYDRPGPRYTSYPTAPVWRDTFGSDEYAEHLRRAGERQSEPLSLYVHIPYCRSMCFYCACSVVITQDDDKGERYVDDVLAEANLVADRMGKVRPVLQHHWGGGTPTFLRPAALRRLFEGLCARFPLAAGAEVSIEVDPRVTTRGQLEVLAQVGFERISMGVQDFNESVQTAIHRVQSVEMTRDLIDAARDVGFGSVNLDLVYGLPHQTPAGFGASLEQVHELGPDRIACYGYAHVPWLKKHQRVIDENTLPRGAEKLALFLQAFEFFSSHGYEAIGMDHFARSDDELALAARDGRLHRNFMGYTTRAADDMVSFGVTAISEVDGAFAQNVKPVGEWRAAIERGELPTERGHTRTDDDERRRSIVLDLMCRFRCRFADHGGADEFRSRYADELARLRPLVDDGLIQIDDEGIEVTSVGRLLVRNVCMEFDAHLGRERPDEGKPSPRFSRTV